MNPPKTLREALAVAKLLLSSEAEAEVLVQAAYRAVTGKVLPRSKLFLAGDEPFPEAAAVELVFSAQARLDGRPLQHITGFQTFLDHEYEVGPDVLVPRPETEVLVTQAIQVLDGREPVLGMEIGVGSGVISVELLFRFPRLEMVASDVSAQAGARAHRNAVQILGDAQAERLTIVRTRSLDEVFEPFLGVLDGRQVDFLISNPPYLLPEDEIAEDVRKHEPLEALYSPSQDPIYFYRRVAEEGAKYLRPGTPVLMEIPHNRVESIRRAFDSTGWRTEIRTDLTGRPRVLLATQS